MASIAERLRRPFLGSGEQETDPRSGTVRLGRRTKDLVKTIGPGDVAVISHRNLDRVAAEDLVASGVKIVLNDAASSDGRYPNRGPLILVEGRVRLIDFRDHDLFDLLREGDRVELDGPRLIRSGELVATGVEQLQPELELQLERQQAEIHHALADFAENTVTRIQTESDLLSGSIPLPETKAELRDRPVLIVVRGPNYKKDLRALRSYIRDMKPVIIGVDGAADAIREAGHQADVILGDMDSATDDVLRSGADLIVHAYPDGRAPGRERLLELAVPHQVLPSAGTSQDVAMLMAFERGASMIVTVGAHFNLTEFLDKDRAGMSSTFLTRLRIGEVLVDARGVSRLHNPGLTFGPLLLFFAAFLILAVIVIFTSPALADLVDLIWLKFKIWLGL